MLEIISAGLLSTIQDKGRYGYQDKGISVAGAMDQQSYELANLLVAVNEASACIEMAYTGPIIKFHCSMEIAITGATYLPTINGVSVSMNETLYVQRGDVLDCGRASSGIYGYIAFSLPLAINKLLGSYSLDLKSSVGGHCGRALKTGDTIDLVHEHYYSYLKKRRAPAELCFPYNKKHFHYIRGKEFHTFEPKRGHDGVIELELTPICNRMGYRFKGKKLSPSHEAGILSEGLSKGTIQGMNSGEWIVLLSDRQSVGGYPRFGHIISYDLSALVHCRPSEKIYLEEISIKEAHQLLRQYVKVRQQWVDTLDERIRCKSANSSQYRIAVGEKTYAISVVEMEDV